MQDKQCTPIASLLTAREIAIKNGVHYAYVGNVHDKAADSTYCYNCGQLLIGRDWYQLSDWNLTESGACISCGTQCAGHFAAKPGDWGARRQAVHI